MPKDTTSGGTKPTTKPSAALDNSEAVVELEPGREPDIFDNDEEYVGVDDEAATCQPTDNANTYATAEPFDEFVHVEVEVDDVFFEERGG